MFLVVFSNTFFVFSILYSKFLLCFFAGPLHRGSLQDLYMEALCRTSVFLCRTLPTVWQRLLGSSTRQPLCRTIKCAAAAGRSPFQDLNIQTAGPLQDLYTEALCRTSVALCKTLSIVWQRHLGSSFKVTKQSQSQFVHIMLPSAIHTMATLATHMMQQHLHRIIFWWLFDNSHIKI